MGIVNDTINEQIKKLEKEVAELEAKLERDNVPSKHPEWTKLMNDKNDEINTLNKMKIPIQ